MNKLSRWISWTKYFIVTFRFSILSIFITLFSATILVIVIINYIGASKTLTYMANQLMRTASNSVLREFSQEIKDITRDNKLSVSLISDNVLNANNQAEMRQYLFNLMKQFHVVKSAHWSDEKGNYVGVEIEANNTLRTLSLDRSSGTPIQTSTIQTAQGKILNRTISINSQYDPRKRPWYITAKKHKSSIWTRIYAFLPAGFPGITIVNPVYENSGKLLGVFGLDIQLKWLSTYINKQKIAENAHVFIITRKGKIIAYANPHQISYLPNLSHIHSVKTSWVKKSFEIYQKTKKPEFSFHDHGEEYLAVYQETPDLFLKNWLIGIVAPKNDFIQSIKKTTFLNSLLSFSILVLGILLISKLVTLLVTPILRLVKEAERIKQFDLEGNPNIQSHIKEILYLSDAFNGMKQGLKSFCSYIPMTLVRQLIETGQNARLGGSKKTIVVFFSDIQDFTSIAHQVDANTLMEQLCEYFDELSSIISQEQGTIDKYIGDSIMAFWGSPLPVENPCHHAAQAALACIERITYLNEQWIKAGKHPFYTRIGLHIGEAIVGNLGSSERMNYTAIGDTINVANRLEGINKKYGTSITASSDVYEILKDDFEFKFLGRTKLKGLSEREKVYELISKKSAPLKRLTTHKS